MRRARTKIIKLNQSLAECKAKYLVYKPINFVCSSCIPTILSVHILNSLIIIRGITNNLNLGLL